MRQLVLKQTVLGFATTFVLSHCKSVSTGFVPEPKPTTQSSTVTSTSIGSNSSTPYPQINGQNTLTQTGTGTTTSTDGNLGSGGTGGKLGRVENSFSSSNGKSGKYRILAPQDAYTKPYGLAVYLRFYSLRGGCMPRRLQ